MKIVKALSAVTILVLALGMIVSAKQFLDLKPIGLKSRTGLDLYARTGADHAAGTCSCMKDTLERRAAPTVSSICSVTCGRMLNPDWFIAYVAAKKIKSTYRAVSFDSDWDKVFFCGWNPERGVLKTDLGGAGLSSEADLADANLVCKKGTEPKIIMEINTTGMDQCMKDCQKCAPPPVCK